MTQPVWRHMAWLFLPMLLLSHIAVAQKTYSSTNKQAINAYENGLKYFDSGQNEKAKKEFLSALQKDSFFVEPRFTLADICIGAGDLEGAIEQYRKVVAINPMFFPTSYFNLANIEFNTGKYKDALEHYGKFIAIKGAKAEHVKKSERRMECCRFALKAMENPVQFEPKNLGESINSKYDEYFPSITVDDQSMIFTRNRPESEGSQRFHEDFYQANRKGDGWDMAKNSGGSLNTMGNEGVPCYSSDGKVLFFAACQRNDGKGSCDIYYSALRKDGWTRPLNLGNPVNTGLWESQPSFSSDGRTLYFIRGRITGYGIQEQDIYMSKIGDDRKWTEPVKLSSKINTPDEEEFVFIHPDDQTLYFSSDGHIGMGGLDIYMSRRQPDGSWGDPVNLGYPINTNVDERGLLVGPRGDIAYISSDRKGGLGGLDLYSFTLHKAARPMATGFVKGKVTDSNDGRLLAAVYEIIDLESGKTMVKSGTEDQVGTFIASLPSGKDYLLNVSKEGYLFYSDNFSCKNPASIDKPYLLDVKLNPIAVGSKVVLKNVFFPTNSFELSAQSHTELNKVIQFLNGNPKVMIELAGHTDNVGDKKSNMVLSQNRAKSVYDFLISKGVSANRISFKGYGDSQPIDSNESETGRSSNRRTEFRITSVK
ncbi:MAG: hypothetical protein RL090_1844 [Bacteroidota bacterium]